MSIMSLETLEKKLKEDLESIEYPPISWKLPKKSDRYDVVIVGAGMAGLTAAFALKQVGISHLHLFDARPEHSEGPWNTYARMKTLRSGKDLMGPALGIPHLTFKAWYKAQFGSDLWEQLYKIPTHQWMEYLDWYRHVLKLPVSNNHTLVDIKTEDEVLRLTFLYQNQKVIKSCHKLILATGSEGLGGLEYPAFLKGLPKNVYAHTAEAIDFCAMKDKCLGVLGVGASAFDATATALEHGAGHVDMFMRRDHIPSVNKLASLTYPGFSYGYYHLPDELKVKFFENHEEVGSPPPFESLDRIASHKNLQLYPGIFIHAAEYLDEKIILHTNKGTKQYDFLILGTGFKIDLSRSSEIKTFHKQISLWKDHLMLPHRLGQFPYLGPHFQFVENHPGQALFLKNIYCFNYAATLSHGLLSSDIPGISVGATRLAQGIASDFFVENASCYLQLLKNYHVEEFKTDSPPEAKIKFMYDLEL